MPEPTFDNVTNSGGEILHAEQQNALVDEIVGAMPDPSVKGGVCKALCARWITSSATNQDFWETLHTPANRETVRLLQHQEAAGNRMLAAALGTADRGGNFNRVETNRALMEAKVKKAFGMDVPANFDAAEKASNDLRDGWASKYITQKTALAAPALSSVKPEELVDKMSQGCGYYLFGLDFENGGGHAMALYNMPGVGVQYFDPNFGEAIFTNPANFKTWMQKHIDDYGSSSGKVTATKLTFIERKTAPNRTDMQDWIVKNAGEERPPVPLPVHWPALESAKAMKAEKQRAQEEAMAAYFEKFSSPAVAANAPAGRTKFRGPANAGQGVNGGQPPANVQGNGVAAPVAVPVGGGQPAPTQPIMHPAVNVKPKNSWRNAGVFTTQ